MEFFIKTKPSLFKTNFENPYATDLYGYDNSEEYKKRQDHDGSWLPGTEEFRQFSEYCWYRYGIPQVSQSGRRIECLKLSKEQHNERWPYAPGQFLLWNILVN